MIIEIGDNGLRSRYWWSSHEVEATEPALAAYQAIRKLCPFLTDENHTWEAKDYGPLSEDASPHIKKLKELTKSSRYAIEIKHVEPIGQFGFHHWFSVAYRVPGEPY